MQRIRRLKRRIIIIPPVEFWPSRVLIDILRALSQLGFRFNSQRTNESLWYSVFIIEINIGFSADNVSRGDTPRPIVNYQQRCNVPKVFYRRFNDRRQTVGRPSFTSSIGWQIESGWSTRCCLASKATPIQCHLLNHSLLLLLRSVLAPNFNRFRTNSNLFKTFSYCIFHSYAKGGGRRRRKNRLENRVPLERSISSKMIEQHVCIISTISRTKKKKKVLNTLILKR